MSYMVVLQVFCNNFAPNMLQIALKNTFRRLSENILTRTALRGAYGGADRGGAAAEGVPDEHLAQQVQALGPGLRDQPAERRRHELREPRPKCCIFLKFDKVCTVNQSDVNRLKSINRTSINRTSINTSFSDSQYENLQKQCRRAQVFSRNCGRTI